MSFHKETLIIISMLLLLYLQFNLSATIRPDCVERSLCYHSTDCCNGCCEDHQCVTETEKSKGVCLDHNVARNCSTLKCKDNEECYHEQRFCLIAPCPQPLPICKPKKIIKKDFSNENVPLPVKYHDDLYTL